ncbi:WD40-like Beta Propeller Repeat [bacterium JGI 053]|nr:WD40-like Beta Propeller Repeat [bacterium JGI 053]
MRVSHFPRAALVLAACAACSSDQPTGSGGATLELSPRSATLQPCATTQFQARVHNAPDPGVTWTSRDPAIADVDAAGTVTGRGIGIATIVASLRTDPARSDSVQVRVEGGTLSLTVSGGVADTIEAVPAQPLVARATWAAGCAAAAVTLRFTSPSITSAAIGRDAAILLGLPGQAPRDSVVEVATDSTGAAQPSVRLGRKAGTYRVRVQAPQGAPADSVSFTVRGGAPYRLAVTPRDTALYPGAAVALRVDAEDRFGNAPSLPITFASRRPEVATVTSTGVVSALSVGRVSVVLSWTGGSDSAALSVVPRGRLVAYTHRYGSGETAALYTFGLDGSDYHPLIAGPLGFNTRGPRWLPGTEQVVFHDLDPAGSGFLRLMVVDPDGGLRPLRQPPASDEGESGAQPTRDGQWVYFSLVPGYQRVEIWRVRPDGTGAQTVSTHTGFALHDYGPSPSPDGSRVAFVTNRTATGSGAVIRVMQVATGTELALDLPGLLPRWSPVGEEIAYLSDGRLRVVRADGGGDVAVGSGFLADDREGSVAWSPDGKWLVTCATGPVLGDRSLVLVNRASGETLPLRFTATHRLCEADWHP